MASILEQQEWKSYLKYVKEDKKLFKEMFSIVRLYNIACYYSSHLRINSFQHETIMIIIKFCNIIWQLLHVPHNQDLLLETKIK